jgi:hypothetical protein
MTKVYAVSEMTRYMVLWKANPEKWPADLKQALNVWEGATGGADQLLKSGIAKEIGFFSEVEGYAIFEADSREKVMGAVAPFHPLFIQEIHEMVPWEKGKAAVLAGIRQAAR